MRIAVVTPYADEPAEWLAQGHASVRAQGVEAVHVLVADGQPDPAVAGWADQHIVLKHRHGDGGNAARMAGGLSAASQRFDAVTFLDPADWFLPGHLAGLAAAAAGVDAATARRVLHRIDGTAAGPCPLVDGVRVVDSSGILLRPEAFPAIAVWCLAPAPVADNAVQSVLGFLQRRRRTVAVADGATVAKRIRSRAFNAPFGPTRWDDRLTEADPPDPAAVAAWWRAIDADRRTRELRRLGVT
ncbi:hypothetical protein STVA_06200 [Allostella vacuolata]|nr:hypothetical protein STVA_06200 [Stella vacuolata]